MNELNITSAKYSRNFFGEKNSIIAVVNGEALHVPLSPANRHYIEIMRQVEAGELVIQEAE